MSVSTKNKRKLVYGNKTYYWHVSPNYDRGELHKISIFFILLQMINHWNITYRWNIWILSRKRSHHRL